MAPQRRCATLAATSEGRRFIVPAQMLEKEHRAPPPSRPSTVRTEQDELRAAALAPGRQLIRGALRPGRRAALAAAVACAAYGTLKLYWALGGGLLLREAPLAGDAQRDLLDRTSTMIALNSASAALAVIGIALALATARDTRLPRLLVVGLAALLGALMLARAGLSAAGDVAVLSGAADGSTYTARWDIALWSPFFAAWGAAWCLAAVAAWRRTAGRRETRTTASATGSS